MAKKDITKMGRNSINPEDRKKEKRSRHKKGRQSVKQELREYTN